MRGGTQEEGTGQGREDLTWSLEPVPTENGLRRPYASANAGSGHRYLLVIATMSPLCWVWTGVRGLPGLEDECCWL